MKRGLIAMPRTHTDGEHEHVRLLLEAGARPNALNSRGQSAVLEAAANGHVALVRTLHRFGGDLNLRDTLAGGTPLCPAAFFGNLEMVDTLLAMGADPCIKDKEGKSPAGWAEMNGHTDCAQRLRAAEVACD